MDHLAKENTEEMIIFWSKQCLFLGREGAVDKESCIALLYLGLVKP